MDRKNRTLDCLVDQREEVIVVGLLRAASEGECVVEDLRQQLCENPDFEPYATFRALQSSPQGSGVLSAFDVAKWLNRQYFKNTMLTERNVDNIIDHYGENGVLRYEGFLKMILPREDKGIRSMVMSRRSVSSMNVHDDMEMGREAGYQLIRLLEQEANLYEELTLRKKRLLEYEWREDKSHIVQRAFTWLQSQSAVPGVCHVSVLGACRLLCDLKEIMSVTDVERLFHRINLSGTDMLSFVEFEKFLQSREASEYLNELYVKYFTTTCPGCGSMCQRDGGACNNITCSICRTTFRCETQAQDAPANVLVDPVRDPVSGMQASRSSRTALNKSIASVSPRSRTRIDYSTLSREVSMSPRQLSQASASPRSPKRGASVYNSNANNSNMSMNSMGSPQSRSRSNLLKQSESMQNYRELAAEMTAEASMLSSPRFKFSPGNRVAGGGRTSKAGGKINGSPSSGRGMLNNSMASTRAPSANQSFRSSPGGRSMDERSGLSYQQSPRTNLKSMSYQQSPRFAGLSPRESAGLHSTNSFGRASPVSPPVVISCSPSSRQTYTQELKLKRQKSSLKMVTDVMFQQLDLDNFLQGEKEQLWQQGVNMESAFSFLDRYAKQYIADTDLWQLMHNAREDQLSSSTTSGSSPRSGSSMIQNKSATSGVSFAGVCALFRDIKDREAKKPGQLNLAELTHLLFPRPSEEWINMNPFMTDDEAKSVLYIVRSTVACPGCGTRTQRTVEGCPQVTCPVCGSVFRCNLIGDDREQRFKLTLTQKHLIRQYIKCAVDTAEEQERLRKTLACHGYNGESISSILLDAFLLMADDKGYVTFSDLKRILLTEKSVRLVDLELLWYRYARDKKRIGFVEFAQQLRPFGSH